MFVAAAVNIRSVRYEPFFIRRHPVANVKISESLCYGHFEKVGNFSYLFPETAMKEIGFTRDKDGLLRIVLTQPYINCKRLATKEEIDTMVAAKGFRDNWSGQGVNYISDRMALEDMHPANVFIDEVSGSPICIDCIVKFV